MDDLPVIYCDMDGVIVDFFRGVRELTGLNFKERITEKHILDAGHNIICNTPWFWENLPPMRDYAYLWSFINKFNPHILTAKPEWDDRNVHNGKWIWTLKYTPVNADRFNCVQRKDKKQYAINKYTGKPNLLIDDLRQNIDEFIDAGGIGIHHVSSVTTVLKLKKLGYY